MEIEFGGGRELIFDDDDSGEGDVEKGEVRGGDGGGGNGYIVWEELTVVKAGRRSNGRDPKKKVVLNGLNGGAQLSRIMAIMGPSGSGKSTLLDALSGRLSNNVVMTGNILLKGKKIRRLDHGAVAYVTQEDVLLGTLTVRETLTYSANLRLPTTFTKEEIDDIVIGTIREMGLQNCADSVIGNWHQRGISGGEKRRVSIALEILTRPQILFLDEPTSGLDSASAFFVVQALRSIARDGRAVISSIHQPSSQVFALFDDLYLLAGGETVFFGEANQAVKFFAEAGFPCPSRRNPSDHFLRCVNSDFDTVLATLKETKNASDPLLDMPVLEIKQLLIQKYKESRYAKKAINMAKEHYSNEGIEEEQEEVKSLNQAGWLKQLRILTKRSFVNMTRDIGYYWLRLAVYIAVSFCIGSLFYDIGHGYTSITARGACSGFTSGFMIFMSIGGFPNFIEEMKVFYKERLNGHYGVAVFAASNFIASFPYLTAITLAAGGITYYMVKYHHGMTHLMYHLLLLFGCMSAIESCMMVVASLVPNFMMGVVTGAGVIGIMMLTSGFYRLLSDLPKVFWRYPISYINFQSWAVQGAFKDLLMGQEFDPLIPGDPKLKGVDLLRNLYKIPLDHSKWWDLVAVLANVVFYRLLFIFILKFKETVLPFLQSFYSKRVLQSDLSMNKSNSFLKKPPLSFGSKRHTLHSLSSQEGLHSPYH